MVRGGLQVKPLSPTHAFKTQDDKLGQLSLNTSFTLLKSLNQKNLKEVKLYSSDTEALNLVKSNLQTKMLDKSQQLKNQNIMLIIVESLSYEYMGINGEKSYTPFLNKLAEESKSFKYAFSGGKRSIDAMPSIFAGLPSVSEAPFITSPYQAMRTPALLKEFSKIGYSSSFYHGGHNGTMYFDTMALRFGFDNYIGMEEYPDKSHYDGKWGIFDHHFLKFMADNIDTQKKPFFNAIFTLSSHHPYKIPSGYENKFPKGSIEIHETIGYADKAIEEFFAYAKTKKWYDNTLFIITADHTQKPSKVEYSKGAHDYRIPLIFFHPKNTLKSLDTSLIASHAAIGSTLYDLFDIKDEWTIFGPSLATTAKSSSYAFVRKSSNYYLIEEDAISKLDANKEITVKANDITNSSKVLNEETSSDLLRALYQLSINSFVKKNKGLIETNSI